MRKELITQNEEQGVSLAGKIGGFLQSLMADPDQNETEKLEIVTRSLGQDIGEAKSGYSLDYDETFDENGNVTGRRVRFEKMSMVIREDLR
jgi:hypothetical protein